MTTKKQTPASTIEQLKALGFSNAVADEPRRIIASVAGKEGTGKSHLLFTAPAPIFLFNIDIGTEGVLEKFQVSGKDIYVYDVRVPKGAKQSVYNEMWAEVKKRIELAYKVGEGTVGIDTASECFELARLAHFGKLTQVMPHNYTEVNSEWREMLRLAYDSKMNTVLIHKVKAEYINDKRTGKFELAGFGETPYMVQVAVTTFKEHDPDDGSVVFGFKVDKCRRRPSLEGNEYRTVAPIDSAEGLQLDPVVNFETLLDEVHGGK